MLKHIGDRLAQSMDPFSSCAQGATAEDVAKGFDHGGFGAVVNSSRGIIYAGGDAEDFVSAARSAAIRMRDEIENVIGKG